MIVDKFYSSIYYTVDPLIYTEIANMDTILTPYGSEATTIREKEVTTKEEPYDDDCVMYANILHATYESIPIHVREK